MTILHFMYLGQWLNMICTNADLVMKEGIPVQEIFSSQLDDNLKIEFSFSVSRSGSATTKSRWCWLKFPVNWKEKKEESRDDDADDFPKLVKVTKFQKYFFPQIKEIKFSFSVSREGLGITKSWWCCVKFSVNGNKKVEARDDNCRWLSQT